MGGPYFGSCLCEAVKFRIDAFLPQIGNCHCRMCRKFHGAAFATYADVEKSKFEWICGEESLKDYTAENGTVRTFCRHCGSSLMFSTPRGADDVVEIALGAVDGDLPVKPDAHVFTDFSANWTTVSDELPKYSAGRDSDRIS